MNKKLYPRLLEAIMHCIRSFSFAFGLACLLPWFASTAALAAVGGTPSMFSNQMVLQRDKPVPVWGSATPGEEVTVEFAGQKKSVKADVTGKWNIMLDPLEASKKPQTMIVKGATGAPIQFEDVLVGDPPSTQAIAPKYVPVKWEEKEAKKLQSEWAARLKVEVETKTPSGIVMVLIPPAGAALPKPYWLGKYELTQAEWEGVMGYNASGFKKGNKEAEGLDTSRFPVERVSWYDGLEFCNKLSEKEGLPPYYELKVIKRSTEEKHPGIVQAEVKLMGGNGYKMPTEFEWEHGGRAGTTTDFCFGDNEEDLVEYGWFGKNSGMRPHPVGEKKPNAFGLHDMHGNLREWVVETLSRDDFSALSSDRAVIPLRGMNRGGGYEYNAKICRFFESRRHGPADRLGFSGFRLARETGD